MVPRNAEAIRRNARTTQHPERKRKGHGRMGSSNSKIEQTLRELSSCYSDGLIPCPLCGRVLGSENVDEHHLVPKVFKGTEKWKLHRVCHTKIHATFTERELANYYHTWERL